MRVLICTQAVDQNDPILGFFHQWLVQFAHECEAVHVLCLRVGEHKLPGNVRVHTLPEHGKVPRAWEAMHFSWRMRHSYDAVFVHMNPEYVVAVGWLWRLLGKRVGLWYVHRAHTYILRIALFLVHDVFTVSKHSFPRASKKVRYTGHGIDTDQFVAQAQAHDGFVITTIGRISEKKNTQRIAEACVRFAAMHPGVRFDIVGSPVTAKEKKYAATLSEWAQAQTGVRILGPVVHPQIPKLLGTTDVFINMGETGGVDKAVLEAMACGVPTISSGEANREVLKEAFEELAIEPTQDALVAALEMVYAMSPQERNALGENLRAIIVRDHSLQVLVRTFVWTLSKNK